MMLRGSHTATCATGARAETRSQCDCGAGERPYRCRLLDSKDQDGKRLVLIETDGPLSTAEAGLFAIQLQELGRVEGERWGREQARVKRRAK